ncbi:MAG: hypothetical protein ABSB26_00620 [Nitrososphaerales archaeon]
MRGSVLALRSKFARHQEVCRCARAKPDVMRAITQYAQGHLLWLVYFK